MKPLFNFKNAQNKVSAKSSMDAVTSYLKSKFKFELDVARLNPLINPEILMRDELIINASKLITSLINNFSEIKAKTDSDKNLLIKSKNNSVDKLSPDEIYQLEMGAIQLIKKSGLVRAVSHSEKDLLKSASMHLVQIYSAQVKPAKTRD